jgi:predicted O-linked N-acetylglucosamine transferase (SPINDLY family)
VQQDYLDLKDKAFKLSRNISLRDYHPYSWDEIYEGRTAFVAALEALENTGVTIPSPLKAIGTSFGYRFGYDGLNEVELRSRLAQFWLTICPDLNYQAEHIRRTAPRAEGKIRVGFFSEFFYNHTVGHFTCDLIKNISRDLFEIIIFYPANTKKDDFLADFIKAADKAIQVPFAIGGARHIVELEQLDILYYPEIGMGPLTYYLAHARLAPVQCTTWGHPVTTGLQYMDYFLSSRLIEPENAQDHYTETLVLLDGLPTSLHKPSGSLGHKATREYFGLPERGTLYMCPQNAFKIHPDFDDYIKGILEKDKDGYFIMNDRGEKQKIPELMARFEKHLGTELCKRICVLPTIPEHEFLDFISLANVLLDPTYFGSGRSGYEAFVAGVPLITHPGDFMKGRVVFGIYQKIGMTDCIANSREEYIEKAVNIANDPIKRQTISDVMKSRAECLFKPQEICRETEKFFTNAYQLVL